MALQQNIYVPSYPVRLFGGGPGGDQKNISYEFLAYRGDGTAGTSLFYWYQEFWNDSPSLGSPPSARTFPGAPPNCGWAIDNTENVGSSLITFTRATRESSLLYLTPEYYPLLVYAYWVRLQIAFIDAVNPPNPDIILRVWAHVGGHEESEYTESLTDPYAYNQNF
jgi:hypothetical protein